MATLIEKIEKSERAVRRLDDKRKKMRKEFLKDGVIDKKEEKQLERIRGKIEDVDSKVFNLRKEFEANKAEWEGKSGQFEEFKCLASAPTGQI